jgi:hypothetical protein
MSSWVSVPVVLFSDKLTALVMQAATPLKRRPIFIVLRGPTAIFKHDVPCSSNNMNLPLIIYTVS